MAYHEMLPEQILALQEELKNWPMISAEAQQAPTVNDALGTIAARIGLLLDGLYDPLDLCDMLTKKLREMRATNLILPDSKTTEVRIRVGENEVILEDVPNPTVVPPKAD